MTGTGKLRMIFAILSTLVLAYVGMTAVLYVFQANFTFFPQRAIGPTPHDVGLAYDAVSFRTEDGIELSAWFVPAPRARATVLFCHGNGGNISDRLEYIEMFHRLHLNTLMFDYRGYGQSGGKPTEPGLYRDAEAAWGYLTQTRGTPPGEVVVFGESLGGAVAAWLARKEKPGALVISSAFTSLPDIAAHHYPFLPARLLCRYRFDTLEYLRGVACPVLILHSCEDEIVPYIQGRRLYETVQGPREFLQIRGGHNTCLTVSQESIAAGLEDFLRRYLRG